MRRRTYKQLMYSILSASSPTFLPAAEYPLLMGLLRRRTHKELAVRIVQSVLGAGTKITSVERVLMLFRFLRPLMLDVAAEPGGPPVEQPDAEVGKGGMCLGCMCGGLWEMGGQGLSACVHAPLLCEAPHAGHGCGAWGPTCGVA